MSTARTPRPEPPAGTRRRATWRWAAAVAVLLGLTAGLTTALTAARVDRAHAEAAHDPLTAQFRQRALNALLVPLLDDDPELRWTDVALRHFCGPATRVEVDGRPMVPGAAVPARAFTVRWQIDQCWPLDYAAFELSGRVELWVVHESEAPDGAARLGAIVDARGLRVASARGSGRVVAPFAAATQVGSLDPRLGP